MLQPSILIIGAGPTGLVLALWLTHLGIKVRIIDKTSEPGTTSRALGVQARTLELYQQIGLDLPVLDRGYRVEAGNLWLGGVIKGRLRLGDIGHGLSPFPFLLIYPQDEHERLLIQWLSERGVSVERQTELTAFTDDGTQVTATLRKPDGSSETCAASYIAGCDGARSFVRHASGIGFPGGTYEQLFYVADVEASGPPMNGELNIDLSATDFIAVFPLKDANRARLIGTVRDERARLGRDLTFEDISGQSMQDFKIQVSRVNWFSTYHVHHRVAQSFKKGRAFLLGDAAHVHSPAGGQGMNTGIGDAINLAWKLAAVLKGEALEALLDSYEPERIAFARRLVATTDQVFTAASSPSTFARVLRTWVIPWLMPVMFALAPVRRFGFRTISQTVVNYRGSTVSAGTAGKLQGGDRLPWIKLSDTEDNFKPLTSMRWQVHIYGDAKPEYEAACRSKRLELNSYEWRPIFASAGVMCAAAYLVRPDGYIGLADSEASPQTLTRYLEALVISL